MAGQAYGYINLVEDDRGEDQGLRSPQGGKRHQELGMLWGICCRYCSSSFCHSCRHSSLVDPRVRAHRLHSTNSVNIPVCTSRKAHSDPTTTSRPRYVASTAATQETRDGKRWTGRWSKPTCMPWMSSVIKSNTHKERRWMMRKAGSSSMKKPWHRRRRCPCLIAIYWLSMDSGDDTRQLLLEAWYFGFCSNYWSDGNG